MKMKKHLILSMLLLGFAGMLEAENVQRTLPDVVEGVRDEVISLNGEWQFQYAPGEKWERVTVPGELAMQGYGIEHDKPVLYKKMVLVPADYRGKQVILRFDGVYSYARLWVNGKQAAEHAGGFTRWETDITSLILYSMSASAKVSFTLKEKKSGRVCLESGVLACQQGGNEHRFRISRPELWDAEHPNLYVLQVNVQSADGGYSFEREIGFRKIEVKGDRMLVNGKQVKLRGACRHDIHPTLGRTSTPELDSLDAALFKRANMNFVRTSHYPPTESFLKYCDREGIYVECETAVCFVDTYRQKNYAPGKSQDDPEATAQYLGQLEEMVATSRSHASVLFWSIGNESVYGKNFQLSYDWLKNEDKTRPVIFSYPGLVEKGKTAFDLLSMHYPGCDGTLSQFNVSTRGFQGEGKPALFDEWAHVPCYTYTTLQDDPNIRGFWAISLDKMWSNLFKAPGGLGGAIWLFR